MYVDELGDTSLVVFRLDGKDSRMSTIVVRGATDNYMDDIERAIDDGVNTFKGVTRVCQIIQIYVVIKYTLIFFLISF